MPPAGVSQSCWVPCTQCMYMYQAGHTTPGTCASAQAVNTHWETQGVPHRVCITRTQHWAQHQEILATHLQAHTPGTGEWTHVPRTYCQIGSTSNTTLAHSSWQTVKAYSGSLASWAHTPGTHTFTYTRVVPGTHSRNRADTHPRDTK